MMFSIIIAPFWAAYTEAWVKQDFGWIRGTVRKLLKVWIVISVVGLFMLTFSEQFYYLWIGDKVFIPFDLSLVLYIYFVTLTFGGVFVMLINGLGKIKLQMYASFFAVTIFIGSAFFFIDFLKFLFKRHL